MSPVGKGVSAAATEWGYGSPGEGEGHERTKQDVEGKENVGGKPWSLRERVNKD